MCITCTGCLLASAPSCGTVRSLDVSHRGLPQLGFDTVAGSSQQGSVGLSLQQAEHVAISKFLYMCICYKQLLCICLTEGRTCIYLVYTLLQVQI